MKTVGSRIVNKSDPRISFINPKTSFIRYEAIACWNTTLANSLMIHRSLLISSLISF